MNLRTFFFVGIIAWGVLARLEAQSLTTADVNLIIGQAAGAAQSLSPHAVIAVSDREGFILGVYGVSGAPTSGTQVANAIAKAGTAAYLSSNGEAFTTRTAGFIIQPHFPPGIRNTAPGPLVGVGFSSLPFSDINHFRNPSNPAVGIPGTSLSGNPGGVPIYKGGVLVGGVGVSSNLFADALIFVAGSSVDESIALTAQTGFAPPSSIVATNVLINGIRLAYTSTGSAAGAFVQPNSSYFSPSYPAKDSPGAAFNSGVTPYNTGAQVSIPQPSPFSDIPGGEVRDPIRSSPVASLVKGQPRLNASEVALILHQAAIRASQTRAGIRSPQGGSPAAVFIVVVDYYGTDGTGKALPPAAPAKTSAIPPATPASPYAFPRPQILGSFRTPDATLFSYDVAAQKARTALFFSNNAIALSSRTVGFLAQSTYPPGIDGTNAGPYFTLQNKLSAAMSGNKNQAINPYLPNGITIFPGGFPLYRNGVLIGAVGVSGDGVDQDDIIAASGTVGFEAPKGIRADVFAYRNVRLPYAKFPQNSSL